ncbi:MAG TPA: serine-type D-Ala-D-Ala carboxypeptidase, partial [Chromatiaceae bacterium]|nr:serine-type D-Ala-D-Ala carboxypeptidase [Chromatiaceae bacterium]
LALGLREDMYITIPRNRYDQLKASMNIRNRIMAPINKGQEIGSVEIKLDGESVFHAPLIALHDVADGTLWQRLKDEARLLIE